MSPDGVHTRPGDAAVLRELDQIRAEVKDSHAETREFVKESNAELGQRMDEVIALVTATNGRLRKAELWISGLKAVGAFLVLLIPFAVVFANNHL